MSFMLMLLGSRDEFVKIEPSLAEKSTSSETQPLGDDEGKNNYGIFVVCFV